MGLGIRARAEKGLPEPADYRCLEGHERYEGRKRERGCIFWGEFKQGDGACWPAVAKSVSPYATPSHILSHRPMPRNNES